MPPPPPPPSPSPPPPLSTEQPTFAELASRLQTLLVKTDAPPITPTRGPPPSSVNATALLNRSMQQLVVTALMRSPSSQSLSSQPTTPRSYSSSPSLHSPDCSQLTATPLSRRSSTSESLYSLSNPSEAGDDLSSEVGEDMANWRDTWRSTSSNASEDSLSSLPGKKYLSLAKRFPGDSRVRSIRRPLELAASSSDPLYEHSKSDHHVVDVKPDPNDSP